MIRTSDPPGKTPPDTPSPRALTAHDRYALAAASIAHKRRLGLPITRRDVMRLITLGAAALLGGK